MPKTAISDGKQCRRGYLDESGHEIMGHIAGLLPPGLRGYYLDDPAIREAAHVTEIYPWAVNVEGQIKGEIH